jgi:hypothetical protein
MFVQVIQGKTDDAAGLRRQFDRWQKELKAGAKGYLGSTFGVTAEGEAIGIARFESAEAAAANSARPEQGEWWAQTEKVFSGPATFHDTSDVDVTLEGGSDDAGFVQVMQGRIHDLAALRKMEEEFMKDMTEKRPDVIGSIRARYGDGEFSEFIYFTSEAEAREGEKRMEAEASGDMAEWERTMSVDRYFDLTEPWLYSP